jgi:hypothetical protein
MFLFKNSNTFVLLDVSLERLSNVKCPEAENIRSDGTLVAVMHRYLQAICDILGYLPLFRRHHSSGFSLRQISLSFSYITYSGSE